MAAPAIPARTACFRFASLIALLACLLALFPCATPSMAMQVRVNPANHAQACHPCCPATPTGAVTALCCTVHPEAATVAPQPALDPPLLQHVLTLLSTAPIASHPSHLAPPQLLPFHPAPLLSLRI